MALILNIINEKGLHARASAKFVEIVEAYDATVSVSKDNMTVSGDSIMGLMMLGAAKGSSIKLEVKGSKADELSKALSELVKNYFGEAR